MTQLLVSVGSVAEAEIALAAGADLIDAKDPTAGALGGLPVETISAIRQLIGTRAKVTAVIGDHSRADEALSAAEAIAATGVDMVKIGLFPEMDRASLIADLGTRLAQRTRLVAVLLADRDPDLALIPLLAQAGFTGVMLDTAGKSGGLRALMRDKDLRGFVTTAHRHGLMAGLAGSLRITDIPALAALDADLLGFRGGLCAGYDRKRPLLAEKVAEAAAMLAAQSRAAAS